MHTREGGKCVRGRERERESRKRENEHAREREREREARKREKEIVRADQKWSRGQAEKPVHQRQ